jgi:hypothetical protein
MDTMRLRSIQQPSRVDALLESYVFGLEHMPSDARRIFDRTELAGTLQKVAIRALKNQQSWGAWTDEHRTWFFTAEMSLPLSRERGRPVLQVSSYSEDGQIEESALWVSVRDGAWQRCTG